MLGYVRINERELTKEQRVRFRAVYCGVCEELREKCGRRGRFALSYDAAFLALVLDALYEPAEKEGRGVCVSHPLRPHGFVRSEFTAYAADINILLGFYNCLDDWADEGSRVKKMGARQLSEAFLQARARRSQAAFAIEKQLGRLRRLEREDCRDVSLAAACFGEMLSQLFACRQDKWAPALAGMGGALGRFIYILDAWDDLKRDRRRGSYNPLSTLAAQPDYEEKVYGMLKTEIALCAEAFETLPVVQDIEIIRNVLYSGIWTRYSIKSGAAHREGKE